MTGSTSDGAGVQFATGGCCTGLSATKNSTDRGRHGETGSAPVSPNACLQSAEVDRHAVRQPVVLRLVLGLTDGIGSRLNLLHGHPEVLVKLSRCHV